MLSFKVSHETTTPYRDMDEVPIAGSAFIDESIEERWYTVYPAIEIIEPADLDTSFALDEGRGVPDAFAAQLMGMSGQVALQRVKESPSWRTAYGNPFIHGSFVGWWHDDPTAGRYVDQFTYRAG